MFREAEICGKTVQTAIAMLA